MRILVIEDDGPIRRGLCDALRFAGYEVIDAGDGAVGRERAIFGHYDLLLLDLRLPDSPGLDVLREIRASAGGGGRYDPALPVIVLSGRATEADRLRGFTEGADDYVIKPFHYPEVAARIRAVLRRRESRREGPRRVGDIFIDSSRREVRVGDRPVNLANKEFSLLCALATEPRRVFTKEELLRDRRHAALLAEFIPTKKNVPARAFYESQGFSRVGEDPSGRQTFELRADAAQAIECPHVAIV